MSGDVLEAPANDSGRRQFNKCTQRSLCRKQSFKGQKRVHCQLPPTFRENLWLHDAIRNANYEKITMLIKNG
ncbi:MAG: hypothetical protein GX799_08925 [Crenarchaeota archaeon]|nr:hypothetical protein [Thermoproteota archaeon]